MYAATIALYHDQLGSNPERISQKLSIYTKVFNWHDTDFTASYDDYAIFEQLNEDIALNILYVPPSEKKYMSSIHIKTQFSHEKSNNIVKNNR